MQEGLIKDAYELIVKEIQMILSLSYVFMIAVGMVFNHCKYSLFGINIFEYADIFDFLIAPFADYRIIVFTLVSLGMTMFIVGLDVFWKRKYPQGYSTANFGWDKKSWFNVFRLVTFSISFLLYTYLMATSYGRNFKKKIDQETSIQINYVDNTEEKGLLIGKTKEVLFLWVNEKVKIIPLASLVKEMEILPKTKITKDTIPEVAQ